MSEMHDPPPRLPPEPLRRIDWLAVAPWVLVFRALRATVGWPLVVGAIGLLVLESWAGRMVIDPDLHESAAIHLARLPLLVVGPFLDRSGPVAFSGLAVLGLRGLAWLALGLVIVRLAAGSLAGRPPVSLGRTIKLLPSDLWRSASGFVLLALATSALMVVLWLMGWLIQALPFPGIAIPAIALTGLLVAAPIAILLAVAVVGAPLLLPAVVIDEADAFDAVSRTFAYTLSRPLTLAWCVLLAAALGMLGGIACEAVYRGALQVVCVLGLGPEVAIAEGTLRGGTIALSKLMHGFFPAYFFTAGTAIYLVMRHAIDGQPLDEIAIPTDQPSSEA